MIRAGTKAAEGVSAADMAKRERVGRLGTGLKLLHGSANESETVIAATFAHEELCIKTIFYLVRSTQVKEK